MAVLYAVLIAAAGVVFVAGQLPNLLRRRLRVRISLAGAAVAVLAGVLAGASGDFGGAAVGLLAWFFGWIVVSGKWGYEVQEDLSARRERGRPDLLRSYVVPVGIRSAVDGFWQLRYRRRMFRDEWSRRHLVGTSQPLPRSLMDERTVADLQLAYREQDEAAEAADNS